nr:E3 ubiquitin-protein ligase RBBP6 [Ciona intestinalis]|eukprot:XP_026689737.1 E3 ubiquitin-protein ligase RBBP6 [Ciona intestinalis]
MSAIHYKFSCSTEYKNVTFDGISLSLVDLKKSIMEKQKLKSTEVDLQITNAQTLQVYKDDLALIPKNTAVLVRRIPLGPVRDSKVYVVKRSEKGTSSSYSVASKSAQDTSSTQPKLSFEELAKTSNLAEANASEEDKIKAAIAQSTNEYDPANFVRPPRHGTYNKYTSNNVGQTSIMRCFRCNQMGHYSTQCSLPKVDPDRQPKVYRHATGIPRSHMVEVTQKSKGAMLTTDGKYVVPYMDKKGYEVGKKEKPPFIPQSETKSIEDEEEDEPIPDELICLLCKDLLVDAVVIPCCGNSYCDECIRNALLDSDDHQCPTCHKQNISPDSLIANKFLRQAVNKFKNDTGIAKKRSNAPVWPRPAASESTKPKQTNIPMKVSYGPPKAGSQLDRPTTSGAYVVKAKTDQIAPRGYSIVKRTNEIRSSSPVDSNQPIRIKLGGSSSEVLPSSATTTPSDQSTTTSITPQSENYTFNSTPDTTEEKPKAVVEPGPPGITPPVAKVVRPLEENSEQKDEKDEIVNDVPEKLSGIHPLPHDKNETNEQPDKQPEHTDSFEAVKAQTLDINIKPIEDIPKFEQPNSINPNIPQIEHPVVTKPQAVITPHVPPTNLPLPILPPVNINIPPPSLPRMPTLLQPTSQQPVSFTQSILGPPPVISKSASHPSLFQRPPPPFPFPPFFPLGSVPFTQPPPGFPPNLPPPGINIQSLIQGPPPSSIPTLTGLIPSVSSSSSHIASQQRKQRSPPPRKHPDDWRRSNHRGQRTKLDLMSDEFTENLSKNKTRRRRRRSYSSSSYSDSSSSNSSGSSYSSGSSSWSSSSYSRSRSTSPRNKGYKKKRSSKVRSRKKSRPRSRERHDSTRGRKHTKRKHKSPPRSRKYSRSNSRSPTPRKDGRGRSDRGRSPPPSRSKDARSRGNKRHNKNSSHPPIPVIGGTVSNPVIPGLPSKEAADYERDQALYAHYRQAYERDWYEKGVMPPPPYDRFVQPRYSRSPSPPGTGSNPLLPGSGQWREEGKFHPHFNQQSAQLYKDNSNFYAPVGNRLQAIASGYDNAMVDDVSPRSSRRYDDEALRGRSRRNVDSRRYVRRGESSDKRVRTSSPDRVVDDGDATPVRDERPPPDEVEIIKKSESRKSRDNDRRSRRDDRRNKDEKNRLKEERRYSSRDSHYNRHHHKESSSKPRSSSKSLKSEEKSTSYSSKRTSDDKSSKSSKSSKISKSTSKPKPVSSKKKISITLKSIPGVNNENNNEATNVTPEPVSQAPSNEISETSAKSASNKIVEKNSYGDTCEPQSSVQNKSPESKTGDDSAKLKGFTNSTFKEISPLETTAEHNVENDLKSKQEKHNETLQEDASDENIPEVVSAADEDESKMKSSVEHEILNSQSQIEADANAEGSDKVSDKKDSNKVLGNKEENPIVYHTDDMQSKDVKRVPSPIIFTKTDETFENNLKSSDKVPAPSTHRRKVKEVFSVEDKQRLSNLIVPNAKPSHSKSKSHLVPREKSKKSLRKKSKDKSNTEPSGKEKKFVEYDGTAPPPPGDELVKINLPKSRWDDSDDGIPHETSEATGKSRRIRIKRKSLQSEVIKDDKMMKGVSDDLASTVGKSSSIAEHSVDAKILITLPQNDDKQNQDVKNRQVSLVNTENTKQDVEEKKEIHVSVKGKALNVTSMRSSRGEEYHDEDALDLQPLSGLSNTESISDKTEKKKKKKKKKKHKNKSKKYSHESKSEVKDAPLSDTAQYEKEFTPCEEDAAAENNKRKHRSDSGSPHQKTKSKKSGKEMVDRKRRRRASDYSDDGRMENSDDDETTKRNSRRHYSRERSHRGRSSSIRDEDYSQRKRRISSERKSRDRSRNRGKKRKKDRRRHRKRKYSYDQSPSTSYSDT